MHEIFDDSIIKGYKINFLKRFFDVIVSSILLILFSPFFLLIALVIKVESKGPILYVCKRVGNSGKIFSMLKFRTMYEESSNNLGELQHLNLYLGKSFHDHPKVFIKLRNDPRVTKIGHYMRKTCIDEFPQLLNILKGEMSIVGNRPLEVYEVQMLISLNLTLRFYAPVGLTGLWQITKRDTQELSERERIKLDHFYAQKQSFGFDLNIFFKTCFSFLKALLN